MGNYSEADIPASIEVEQWRQRGELVNLKVNNLEHEVFVIDEEGEDSSKPVLLLVHGFPTSSWDWAPMWPQLLKQFRLVAMDMLGFGFTDKPNKRNYTIHKQADLVEAVVRYKGLQACHVLAHDYGDTVSQELLARQNEGVGEGKWLSCCFLNGGLFPETHRALLTQKLLLSPIGGFINRLSGYKQFRKNFSHVFGANTKPSEAELASFWKLINHKDGKHLFHNLMTYINDRKTHRVRWIKALQQSQIPLALINGSVDPVSGKHMVERYKELECRLDYLGELGAIGHYPQVEAPNDVAQHYLKFLNAIS
ncbi:alpha/beta fold hydrolase [Maricurvus nonylphenolicus]|uniref:alpha/beta fold hydrolase n=1 Tax=Maricurvus nonylphenolicus TaxID=1008307 RepID=UPI0036F37C20